MMGPSWAATLFVAAVAGEIELDVLRSRASRFGACVDSLRAQRALGPLNDGPLVETKFSVFTCAELNASFVHVWKSAGTSIIAVLKAACARAGGAVGAVCNLRGAAADGANATCTVGPSCTRPARRVQSIDRAACEVRLANALGVATVFSASRDPAARLRSAVFENARRSYAAAFVADTAAAALERNVTIQEVLLDLWTHSDGAMKFDGHFAPQVRALADRGAPLPLTHLLRVSPAFDAELRAFSASALNYEYAAAVHERGNDRDSHFPDVVRASAAARVSPRATGALRGYFAADYACLGGD